MHIFKGMFSGKKLRDINTDVLNNDIWSNKVKKKIKFNKKYFNHNNFSSVLSTLFSTNYINKNLKILDIGSGALDVYFELNNIIKNYEKFNKIKIKKKIFLDLVEVPDVIKIYKKIKFSKNFKCSFSTKLKKIKYDIIYISNTLHYIDEPHKFIIDLVNTKSEYIILNSTRVGNIKTFIALQKFYKYKIPTWFFNLNDLIKKFHNYKLVYVAENLDKYFGKLSEIPMKNYPKKLRLKHCKILIFKRKK